MSPSLESWIFVLGRAILVLRLALGRRLRLTSSIRWCLGVILAIVNLSQSVMVSMRKEALLTSPALAIGGVMLAGRIVNHRALVMTFVAEAFQVHLAHLIRIS